MVHPLPASRPYASGEVEASTQGFDGVPAPAPSWLGLMDPIKKKGIDERLAEGIAG